MDAGEEERLDLQHSIVVLLKGEERGENARLGGRGEAESREKRKREAREGEEKLDADKVVVSEMDLHRHSVTDGVTHNVTGREW